jgi:hypothetical protein
MKEHLREYGGIYLYLIFLLAITLVPAIASIRDNKPMTDAEWCRLYPDTSRLYNSKAEADAGCLQRQKELRRQQQREQDADAWNHCRWLVEHGYKCDDIR